MKRILLFIGLKLAEVLCIVMAFTLLVGILYFVEFIPNIRIIAKYAYAIIMCGLLLWVCCFIGYFWVKSNWEWAERLQDNWR